MMHDIAVRCGDWTRAVASFRVPKVEHREDHGVGFGEGSNLSTRAGTNRVVVSRMGGTSTTLGTSRANWVCSHVGGTCSRLQSRAVRTAGIGERLRLSRSLGGRSWVDQVQAAAGVPQVRPALLAGTGKRDDDDPEDCLRKSSQ